jgi:hypothetical protein
MSKAMLRTAFRDTKNMAAGYARRHIFGFYFV